MSANSQGEDQPGVPRRRWSRTRLVTRIAALGLLSYLVIAYLLMPLDWMQYVYRHPAILTAPGVTHTTSGIPGDPINVGLVGTESSLQRALLAAKWYPADPITLKSSLRIAADTVLKRPYDDAPVSSLYLWRRKQDFAFEQPAGDDPRRRHHVRFWKSEMVDVDGKPMWFGAATFDIKVGLSHTTGEITHHIDANVDAERNRLLDDLQRTGFLTSRYWVNGFQSEREGKNGGGDRYQTDGRLGVGVLSDVPERQKDAPE